MHKSFVTIKPKTEFIKQDIKQVIYNKLYSSNLCYQAYIDIKRILY